MTSDNPHSHSDSTLIPVHVDDVDRLDAIARSFDGIMLILGTAAPVSPAFEAVNIVLQPVHTELQEFRNRFNRAWKTATTER